MGLALRFTSDGFISLCSETEILLSYPAGIMCDEGQAYAVVTDIDIWMVPRSLGQLAHLVHKAQGGAEVFKLKCLHQLTGFDLPTGESS